MKNFKIQEATSVVVMISLNSHDDSVVSLLSKLWGGDCKLRKSYLSNVAVQSVTVKHVRWNLQRLKEYRLKHKGKGKAIPVQAYYMPRGFQ